MGKKKKIREEFDDIFKLGNREQIKEMLEKNPWLREEIRAQMEENISEQSQVVAAVGVMEDELGAPVPFEEIMACLNVDFNFKNDENRIKYILDEVEKRNLVKKESNGWSLTEEGEDTCDTFLNKELLIKIFENI